MSEDPQTPESSVLARLLSEGATSHRYAYEGEIARGGMGAILKVWDEDFRRTLAMKVILGPPKKKDSQESSREPEIDERRLTRFLEEAQITGQLDHPGIVPVHELGLDQEGRVYFTMRLVKGRDLKGIFDLVRSGQEGWTTTRALGVIQRVCEAMAFAHEKGVVHRDLKPANIMVGRFGETYVMDWGLAKVIGKRDTHDLRLREQPDAASAMSLVRTDRKDAAETPDSPLITMDGDVMGTPCYMAPEQARGRLDDIGPHSDIYSVGSLLYELLTGQMPYVPTGEKVSPHTVLGLLMHGPPQSVHSLNSQVPGELIAVCEKAMARRPEDRYASMLSMAEDLRAFLEGRVVHAYETGAVAEFRKWISRNRGTAGAAAAAVLLAIGGATYAAWIQSEATTEQKRINKQLDTARNQAVENESKALEAKSDLEALIDDLAAATEEARAKADEARLLKVAADLAKEDLSDATEAAIANEQRAERLGYAANVAAAEGSLRFGEASEARRRLELCEPSQRHWEWHRLRLESDSSLRAFEGSGSSVLALDFSPDGRQLVTGGEDRTVRVLDSETGQVELELSGHKKRVLAVAWNPSAARIVSGSSDGELRVWNAESGATVLRPGGHSKSVAALAWSPDGQRFLSGSADSSARLWDAESGSVLVELEGHDEQVTAVAFHPTGERVATASADGSVRIWSVDGSEQRVLRGPPAIATFVAFSPDGLRVTAGFDARESFSNFGATGAQNNTVHVWDALTGSEVRVLWGHIDGVRAGAVSPDGRELLTASADRTLRVWNLATGRATVLLGSADSLTDCAYSPDGRRVASSSKDGKVRIWDTRAGLTLTMNVHHAQVTSVATMPGRVASSSADKTLRLWDARSGLLLSVLSAGAPIDDMDASDDGRRIVASAAGSVRVWDANTGAHMRTLASEGEDFAPMGVNTDGEQVAAGSSSGRVFVWDVASGDTIVEFEGHTAAVTSVAVSPSGRLVISGSRDASVRVWDVDQEQLLEQLGAAGMLPTAVAVSPDESTVAAAFDDDIVRVWSTEGGRELFELSGHIERISDLAYSADGRRIVSVSHDSTLRLWDVGTGEALITIRDGTSRIHAVDFDAESSSIVAAFMNGMLRVWPSSPSLERFGLRREATDRRLAAVRIVDPLFRDLTLPERVIERLQADTSLSAELRTEALVLARLVGDDPEATHQDCWSALISVHDEETCSRALWGARVASARAPGDERFLRLVGMAWYRAGEYQQALDNLQRSQSLRAERLHRPRPEVTAFLAMTKYRLGRTEESKTALAEMRELMRIPMIGRNRDYQSLLSEAEALLKAGR